MPTALVAQYEEGGCLSEDGAGRWCPDVSRAAPPDDQRTDAKKDCWEKKCEPKSYPFLGVHHSYLANESPNVNEEVEVVIDSRLCHSWVDNHTLARRKIAGNHLGKRQLLRNERGNIGLECSCPNTHNNKTD